MPLTHLTTMLATMAVVPLACQAAQAPAAGDQEARVAWLKNHAIPLRSIDPDDDDFADLEPLRKAIGDARIVQLGEQSLRKGQPVS